MRIQGISGSFHRGYVGQLRVRLHSGTAQSETGSTLDIDHIGVLKRRCDVISQGYVRN